MSHFILRFKGRGAIPESHLATIRSSPDVTVLDSSSPRMLLVQATPQTIQELVQAMPGWIYTPEQTLPLPDPRPKIRSS